MADTPACIPDSPPLLDVRSRAGAKLRREILRFGESALLACEQMVTTAGDMIEDNQRLMGLDRGIRKQLALDKKRRKHAKQEYRGVRRTER